MFRQKKEIARFLHQNWSSVKPHNNSIDAAGSISVILMSARSGSTYLQSMLNSLHQGSVLAAELLAPDLLQILEKDYSWGVSELLQSIQACQSNGINIIWKLNYHHYRKAQSEYRQLKDFLFENRFIYRLTRLEIKDQILSRYYARSTGLWERYNNGEVLEFTNQNKRTESNEIFELFDAISFILSAEMGWDTFCDENGLNERIERIVYEELVSDPLKVINKLETIIGLNVSSSDQLKLVQGGVTQKMEKNKRYDEDRYILNLAIERVKAIM